MTQPVQLPVQVIDTILSHLVPPTIPLPRQLVAQPILRRLEFVPPDIHDTDAYLTPNPDPSTPDSPSTSLTALLGSLVDGYTRGEVTYGYDGETVFARIPLSRGGETEVRVMFSYEDGQKARGWVYHAVQKPTNDTLAWSETLPQLPRGDAPPESDTLAPKGYWEGFTPPTRYVDLSDKADDDYWASYGTPQDMASRPRTPIPTHVPEKRPDPSDLRDKMESKIMYVLRNMWTEWTRGAEREDELEERALGWLRVCRLALEGEAFTDPKELVLCAKIQVCQELSTTVTSGEGAFWRMVEKVVQLRIQSSEPSGWE
ncbi:hypothetical protein BD324DRAFT_654246 [Kockovaella imperatae]|uniref:Uncharacterized protein n=1 Tax=Kockovaella imperatae TaxID=4999 RepID=A0A1Y1U714_9TREE|nr:hypothetical protein BD324DRAFT_654246 [Kockovaella imperatae]ORX33297.1 hypothetical protein BD324DRAFT_654246 [Kockovaella imperatae]